ncbi:hypothetical protein FRB94_009722 [Tulasnella sp. JGI-2019a]|nr:hypothetical protein FRB94_009722 [Tulasnella sp. JGI-2019a]
MSQLPSSHRALTAVNEPKGFKLVEKPLPTVGDNEILIKVRATSLNPTDWKHVHSGSLKDGSSTGSDFAGDVVKVGSGAEGQGIKVGDAVAGVVRGGYVDDTNGAFQEYVKSHVDSVWHIPTDKLTYEQASPMGGIALSTAVQALFNVLALPTPWEPAKEPLPVLIWAGSTSVGIYAITLAKLAGFQVATTASHRNHEFLKKLGTDVIFDYKDPEAPKKIKEWSNGKITHAFDTISEHGSTKLCGQAFSDQGGKIVTLLPNNESGVANVTVERTVIYTGLDPSNGDHKLIAEWYRQLPKYATQLNVMPLKKWLGGLAALPEALDYLKAGKTSAEKISVTYE